jgi:ABC-type sugar transport system substrate-binding protein
MHRVRTRVQRGLAVLSLLMATGCGQDPFGAPARSSPPVSTEDIQTAKAIYMVIPSRLEGEVEVWGILAQREANDKKAIFRLMGPTPDQPVLNQSEVVRKAVDDGATALIVIPGDSADLAQTLVEIEAKGVPVVLLGRTIAAPAGAKPFTYVDHEPCGPLAKRIVATMLEDLKKAKRPTEGTVLLIMDKSPDPNATARMGTIKTALEGVGLRSVVEVTFDGNVAGDSQAVTLEAVKSHPDVIMAIADEGEGIQGASRARISLGGEPAFFVGGFAGYRKSMNTLAFQTESCYVEGRVDELSRLAVVTALKKLKGEPITQQEGRVELPAIFNRGSGQVAAPVQKGGEVTADSINKGLDGLIRRGTPATAPPNPKP